MGRTRARRRARPVSPPQFGLRFTDIFLDNERHTEMLSPSFRKLPNIQGNFFENAFRILLDFRI